MHKKNEPLVFFWGVGVFAFKAFTRERVCLFIHILLHSLPTLLFNELYGKALAKKIGGE